MGKTIVTCCPSKIHNGVWRHLKELEHLGTMHFDIDDELPFDESRIVIFGGAWNPKYAELNTECKKHNVSTGILFCSPYGQATLSSELKYLIQSYELFKNRTIDYIFTGTQEMANIFKHERIIYLPQTLDYNQFFKKIKAIKEYPIRENSIGLFCSKAPHKNITNQLMALKRSKYHLFTNALNDENTTLALMNDIRYTNLNWMSDEEYYSMMKSIPIHLQCSFSEAFDYVVAETLLMERPIIVGPTIDWVTDPAIKVKNIDNPYEIRNAIDRIMNDWESRAMSLKQMTIEELDKRDEIAKSVLERI